MTDAETLADLVRRGVLIGVEVFGTDDCCEHGPFDECPANGFGLCDTFGPASVGSDCNRAERWIMRPSDEHMTDDLHALLNNEGAFNG